VATTAAAPRRFQLGVRTDFPAGVTPSAYFDRVHRANGVNVETLGAETRQEYEAERTLYEHTCVSLMRSRRRRERLAQMNAVAEKWARREAAAGRTVWASAVPDWFMAVHGVAVRPAAAVTQRRHETAPHRRARGRPSSADEDADEAAVAPDGAR
jgi:hypothetical protein